MAWVLCNTRYDINLPLILYAGPLPCWLMFFVIGMVLGQNTKRNYSIIIPLIVMCLGFALSVIEANYLFDNYHKGFGIKSSSFLFSGAMIFLLFSNVAERHIQKLGVVYNFFVKVGRISFGIYLIHCYFIRLVNQIHDNSWFLRFFIVFLATSLTIIFLKKILPTKVHKYLGI